MSRTGGLRGLIGGLDGVLRSVEQVADALDDLELGDGPDGWASMLDGWERRADQGERARALRVLGFQADAQPAPDEIKAAYRAVARREHPDAGGDPDRFARAVWARDTLLDA